MIASVFGDVMRLGFSVAVLAAVLLFWHFLESRLGD